MATTAGRDGWRADIPAGASMLFWNLKPRLRMSFDPIYCAVKSRVSRTYRDIDGRYHVVIFRGDADEINVGLLKTTFARCIDKQV